MQPSLKTYRCSSIIKTSLEEMLRFHQDPRALSMLTPPPIIVQIVRDERTSLTQGELLFRLWFGPLPVLWLARHEQGSTPTSFIDRMIIGPMANWQHEHRFQEVAGGVALTDEVTFAHHTGWRGFFTRMMFDGAPLKFLFFYRHLRTKRALE